MYIDSHCHLNHEKIIPAGTPAELVARAKAEGVAGMVTICCRLHGEPASLREIAAAHDNVWYTIGTHPHDASQDAEKAFTQDRIVAMAKADPKIVGIGESGLDYYYDLADRADQAATSRNHIRACIERGLPLVVHARDADEDIIRILKEEGAGTDPRLKGVMHCFSSTPWLAEKSLEIGFYISFSGIVTFKSAANLRDIAKTVPLDKMLIETDAPYLAPEPNRKKTNEPAQIVHTARLLGDLHDRTGEEIGEITAQNFFTLFDRARDTWQQPAQ